MEMDLDDLESATHLSLARLAILRRRPLTFLSNMAGAAQYRLIEQRCLAGYRTVYLASREDVEVLRSRLPLLAVESMPNRVLDRAIRRQRISGDKTLASFLFVGTLDYLPNEDAVLWLAEAIAIALDARLGRPFRLIVAGRGASKSLRRRLAKCLAVDFRGEVEELDALYEEAHAALIPLRGGGGTKLKLLEAFRYGCPVIATKHGVRGSGAGPGEHYLAAETADEFAEQCARLLENPDLGRKVAASARVLLEHSFLLRPVEAVRPR
jgi:glycosyltransferase involved in cell wall biosynthesis